MYTIPRAPSFRHPKLHLMADKQKADLENEFRWRRAKADGPKHHVLLLSISMVYFVLLEVSGHQTIMQRSLAGVDGRGSVRAQRIFVLCFPSSTAFKRIIRVSKNQQQLFFYCTDLSCGIKNKYSISNYNNNFDVIKGPSVVKNQNIQSIF